MDCATLGDRCKSRSRRQ